MGIGPAENGKDPKMTKTMTYDEVVSAIVERDVAKWGEGERAASERLTRKNYPTIGLALNHLAHYDISKIDDDLAKRAKALFTPADRKVLRSGW